MELKMVDSTAQMVKVEDVRIGDYVRRSTTTAKTYKRGAYDRSNKKFELIDCDDISHTIMVKRGTMLHIGFIY